MSLILFNRLYDIGRPTDELVERRGFGEDSRKIEKDEYQEMIAECDIPRPLRDLRIAIFGCSVVRTRGRYYAVCSNLATDLTA